MRANFDFDVHKSLSVIPAGDFSKVLMGLRLNFFKSLILQLKTKIKSIRPLKPSIFGPIIEIFKRMHRRQGLFYEKDERNFWEQGIHHKESM